MWSSFLLFPSVLALLVGSVRGATPLRHSDDRASYTLDEMYKLQVRFLDNYVFNSTLQTKSINSTLIAPDCLGRVDVTRTFVGQELNTEYIFGTFAQIQTGKFATLLGYPVSYNITHFTANQDVSSTAVVIFFNNTFLGVIPVEVDTWITWNKAGQIWQYDITFRWFANLLDATVAAAMPIIGATTPAAAIAYFTTALATGVCTVHQDYCTGANQQYTDFDECYTVLTTEKRFGASYELGADTLLCRMVHQNMVPLRPEVHCPHIGPSGGGMCVDDTSYAQRVLEALYTHAPMMPQGYENPNQTIAEW